jgi:hypothetical protein
MDGVEPMEKDEAEALVNRLGLEFQVQTDRISQATKSAVALRKVLLGYGEMFPTLMPLVQEYFDGAAQWAPPSVEPVATGSWIPNAFATPPPRGAEAVHLILQECPNVEFRVSECVAELRKRGWLPDSNNPANAVRAALERLVTNSDESDVVKIVDPHSGYVAYAYQPDRIRDSDGGGYGFDKEPF